LGEFHQKAAERKTERRNISEAVSTANEKANQNQLKEVDARKFEKKKRNSSFQSPKNLCCDIRFNCGMD
jgi:hypothetical protein